MTTALQINGKAHTGVPITSNNGKVTGHRFTLGAGPISAARKAYKVAHPKATNREASKWIGEQLANGTGSLARLQVQAALEVAYSNGMHGTQFDLREKSAVIRFAASPVSTDAAQEKAIADAVSAANDKAVAALMGKLSCTREEALAML